MIHANDFGLTRTRKQPLEIPAHRRVTQRHQLNAQEITAEEIAHSQRIDLLAVTRPKPLCLKPLKSTVQTSLGACGSVKLGRVKRGPRRAQARRRRTSLSRCNHLVIVRIFGNRARGCWRRKRA